MELSNLRKKIFSLAFKKNLITLFAYELFTYQKFPMFTPTKKTNAAWWTSLQAMGFSASKR